MTSVIPVTLVAISLVASQGQLPLIQNGRIESRPGTTIDREIGAAGAASADPVWLGWRVPIVAGQRGGCSTYSDSSYFIRGDFLEGWPSGNVPQIAAPPAVPLEAGSGLLILLRVVDGKVERMRTLGDDCPIDAGGRTVYWLASVTPADSLKYLEGLLRPTTGLSPVVERRLSESAVPAIALHRDAGADTILDRLASGDADSNLRRVAWSALGSYRGAHGFAVLRQLIDTGRLPDIRRQLVNALGQTREPGTPDALLAIAKNDVDPKTRAEAVYWLPQRGGPAVVAGVTAIIDADGSDEVKQRAVKGLARLSGGDSVPVLLQLARTSTNPVVKKEAVAALAQSKDPRAMAFLEQLLK